MNDGEVQFSCVEHIEPQRGARRGVVFGNVVYLAHLNFSIERISNEQYSTNQDKA